MSRHWHCDRCQTEIHKAWIKDSKFLVEHGPDFYSDAKWESRVDLCPKCRIEFEKFMQTYEPSTPSLGPRIDG